MQLGDFPAAHTHTHTHDIAIFFGFEKTIMKFNKLGMSSARLENVLVAPLQDCRSIDSIAPLCQGWRIFKSSFEYTPPPP